MPRYIDADALRERVLYRKKPRNHMDDEAGAYDRGFNAGIFAASKEIDSAPTVSPDEARGVGEWTDKRTIEHDGEWWCTACGKEITIYMGKKRGDRYKFCPNCGAKMEVSEDA